MVGKHGAATVHGLTVPAGLLVRPPLLPGSVASPESLAESWIALPKATGEAATHAAGDPGPVYEPLQVVSAGVTLATVKHSPDPPLSSAAETPASDVVWSGWKCAVQQYCPADVRVSAVGDAK